MPKHILNNDVYKESVERVKWTFDNFKQIYVSFSAGKDSTVMLHLAIDEAKKRNMKIGLMIVDLEGQYKLTIDHIKETIKEYDQWIDLHWICLPLHLRNAVSVYEPFWKCWDADKKKEWIRELPENSISDHRFFDFFTDGMEFEEFVPEFGGVVFKRRANRMFSWN